MPTSLNDLFTVWHKQIISCFGAVVMRGRSRNMVTVLTDGEEVAVIVQRQWDDEVDMVASWREVGDFAAKVGGDTVAVTFDGFIMFVTAEELESPDFVRPRDNFAATEALQSVAFQRGGAVTVTVITSYGRGDDGKPYVIDVDRREGSGPVDAVSAALVDAMCGPVATDVEEAARAMASLGHVVSYGDQVFTP